MSTFFARAAQVGGAAAAMVLMLASAAFADTATLITETGAHAIEVEVADTPSEREIGLMNRESLAEGTGMLFDFRESRPVSMWMKNTLIPLDMLFVDKDGTIVRIARNAKPHSLETIPSGKTVRFVVEINGGAAATYGAKAGDKLEHSLIKGR
ncbi:DUF192 domain-containing protein [Aureimonas phyllosphaerae]|uniref:DUF192 domain-containing protein n=1 Tax=Aureimonas phyllosphaerae TaxID=1166078 RepID=A0A7W6BX03_9HYPH|nr:DUF192 domain-containing protein [Aureimonas phyllosphaerae]MBB3935291.1 hypothetical protein [Aureimonas phyllosphaerae]MBB3959299.1 hypothetical protein [Aureimonas phyllosphaerae]SFF05076.1 hypothetical protein SAMN05216566_102124 [Aureimonas phyllosphaerae]